MHPDARPSLGILLSRERLEKPLLQNFGATMVHFQRGKAVATIPMAARDA